MNSMERVRSTYKVPAKQGMRVECDGRPGRITSSTGAHLRIRFDEGGKGHAHPTWRMVYILADGTRESFGMDAK